MQVDCADSRVAEASSSDLAPASAPTSISSCYNCNRFSLPPAFLPPASQDSRTTLKLQGKYCGLSCLAATVPAVLQLQLSCRLSLRDSTLPGFNFISHCDCVASS